LEEGELRMANRVKDLSFSHIGSGMLVFNKRTNRDVAHISKGKEITYYSRLGEPVKERIRKLATTKRR
jgi:hypothetical protein